MQCYTKNFSPLSKDYIYQNYHKHSIYTNVIMLDSVAYPEDYAKKAKELGHGIISSCEHGYQGRYIESFQMAEKYDLKFLFAVESYFVKNRFEKDKTNAHMILAAKNENGRKAINRILSEANEIGFYYRARIDFDLLFSLPKEDVWITSACLGGVNKYSDYEKIIKQIHNYFGDNFYLEVQAHNVQSQKDWNSEILRLSKKYNIEIIAGVDSHYINPEDAWMREYLQKSGHIFLEEEEGFYMDYPSGETLYKRFQEQGVLDNDDIQIAMNNTNVFLNVEYYDSPIFNHEVKMPSAPKYANLSKIEKDKALMRIVYENWQKEKQNIPKEKWKTYEQEIVKELKTIFEINHSDYFLLNYEIIKNAVDNKGGMITYSGRGSGPSFYVNHLLGFTAIDRISCPITLYPERFLSASRIKAGSLADIDFNCGNVSVFAESQREILGKNHAYPMITFGLLKAKSAWKMYCRANDVDFEIANKISSNLEDFEKALKYYDPESGDPEPQVLDYIPQDLQETFLQSKKFLGLVDHAGVHACLLAGTKVLTEQGYVPIEEIQMGDKVLSHDNKFHKVVYLMNRESVDYYNLKLATCESIRITGNHPVYVKTKEIKKGSKRGMKKAVYGSPYWKPVKQLTKDDKIGIAINQNSIVPRINGLERYCNNPNFWWFIGRFIGDGWIEKVFHKAKQSYEYRIIVCCDKKDEKEKNDIINHIEELFQYRVEERRTTYKIFIKRDDYLFKYLESFSCYAHGKHLNSDILNLPIELLKNFLDGYFSADGWIQEDKIKFSTVSENLFYDLQQCIHKVYKIPVSMSIRKAQTYIIEGRIVNGKKQYNGTIKIKRKNSNKPVNFYEDGLLWVRIRDKELISEKAIVYNMEVEETHSYNVYGAVVHNCGHLLATFDIREEVGIMRLKSKGGKETMVTVADGKWVEKYLMLKNDLLSVTCVKLVYLLYERCKIKPMSLTELMKACKEHPEVWKIYENGYTLGVNQLEKNSSKHKAMKYKPHNISELSALIAGIRPAFKSLIDKLINREDFSYNLSTFDKLLQTEELPQSFILYQEQIMKVLAFAGIPMDDCYTVIKSISKKRVAVIESYKTIFLNGFSKAIQEQEHKGKEESDQLAVQIWGIIQDASAYGFNSSHSLSVSFDSLLAAYFKALYPLEFYEVYLNVQMDRADKAKALLAKEESRKAFGITILPMRFGQDNRKFTAYPEKNALSNCLKSIKGFGTIVGDELYKISKNSYDNFLDLLVDMKNLKINKTQIEILIKLNYFEEFGKNKKLLYILELFQNYMGKSQINKKIVNENPNQWNLEILKKYLIKECNSIYKVDFDKYIKEIFEKIEDKSLSLREQLEFERKLLEIPIYVNKIIPSTWYYVLGFKVYNDKKNLPYLILYQLQTGNIIKCSINKGKLYDSNPFYDGSILNVLTFADVAKRKQTSDGKWQITNELKTVIKEYEVLDNYNRNVNISEKQKIVR